MPEVNDQVGDYILLDRLGEGGEGMVYTARHRLTDQIVALKVVVAIGENSSELSIRHDARALASLRHVNIVPMYFFGEDSGVCYYAMSLMQGGSLEKRLVDYRTNISKAVEVVESISRAMHHAHSRGILHLDLKPANVLLDEHGRPHVSDFGLAKRIENQAGESKGTRTAAGADRPEERFATEGLALSTFRIRGTAPYMSPEMASGNAQTTTTAADVYGLGAILYTLLTGRPPFCGETTLETLNRVLWDQVVPPRRINKRVDAELEAVCLKALNKDPCKRYGSADALANDLKRWSAGEPTLAGKPTIKKHLWFGLRRRPLWVLGAVCVLFLVWSSLVLGSLGELRSGNKLAAQRLAREAEIQLGIVQRAVAAAAADPSLLERMTAQTGPDECRRRLSEHLNKLSSDLNAWFGVAGGNPVINVFILDDKGILIADTLSESPAIGRNFSGRDYFKRFQDRGAPASPNDVHVSMVFRSVKDSLYKVSVSTRIWNEDACLGVLAANITVGPRLVVLDMWEEEESSAIFGPLDPTESGSSGPAYGGSTPSIAVLDRRYASPLHAPIWAEPARHAKLEGFYRNAKINFAQDVSENGYAIDFHRVGSTPLVAVVERPFPGLLRLVLDGKMRMWIIASTLVLATALCCLALARRVHFRRSVDAKPA